jgi:hypothetical protein
VIGTTGLPKKQKGDPKQVARRAFLRTSPGKRNTAAQPVGFFFFVSAWICVIKLIHTKPRKHEEDRNYRLRRLNS